MFASFLAVFFCCALAASQKDETSLSSPVTAFGGKLFLPEIFPLKVQRSLAENGDLRVTIDLLYSEDAIISWVAHGSGSTYIDHIYLRVPDTVPSEYTLQLSIPRGVIQRKNVSSVDEDIGKQTVDEDIGKQTVDGVVELEDGDFLVDFKELYIKFQVLTLPEAAVMKISLNIDDPNVKADDKEEDNVYFVDEDKPKFPEMMELKEESIIITPGLRSSVSLDVLFTNNDRYSVRGLIYNSSSNTVFTTLWSSDYFLGQSDFQKIPTDDNIDNFDDNVKLVDSFDFLNSSNIKKIIIDIPTDKADITGVYTITAHHEAGSGDHGIILESSLEQDFVILKESQEHGPIPSGILQFEGGIYSRVICRLGQICVVSCHVYGIGVQSLQLMHKDAKSEFVALPKEHPNYGPYESDIVVLVDSTNPAFSGTYICKADSGPRSISKEIDVILME